MFASPRVWKNGPLSFFKESPQSKTAGSGRVEEKAGQGSALACIPAISIGTLGMTRHRGLGFIVELFSCEVLLRWGGSKLPSGLI